MFKKLITITICLLGAMILACGCNITTGGLGAGVRGEGEMVSRDFTVGDFTVIDISGISCIVSFSQNQNSLVTIEMQDNLFDYLDVSVRDGVLFINSNHNFDTSTANRPRVYISAPTLSGLNFEGAIDARNWDPIYAQRFVINGVGAGNISLSLEVTLLEINTEGGINLGLSGNANTVNIFSEGAVNIEAFDLYIATASIELIGAGNVDISVADTLDVIIEGIGRIQYRGEPLLTQRVSGIGWVRSANSH